MRYICNGTLTTWNVPYLDFLNMYVIKIEPKKEYIGVYIIAQTTSTPRPVPPT